MQIEREILDSLDVQKIIAQFSAKAERRLNFYWAVNTLTDLTMIINKQLSMIVVLFVCVTYSELLWL